MSDDPRDPSPTGDAHNSVHGGAGGNTKIIQSRMIENLTINDHTTGRRWRAPGPLAAPPRHNHEAPLSELVRIIRDGREHATVAVVAADAPRLGSSTVCRAALSAGGAGDGERFGGGFYDVDIRRDGLRLSVASLLRRLGLTDDQIPAAPGQREARLREELSRDLPVAMLVDNATRYEDVIPFLLPTAGSVTLVATHQEGRFDEREPRVREVLAHFDDPLVGVPAMSAQDRADVLALHAGLPELSGEERAMALAVVESVGDDLAEIREVAFRIRRRRARGEDGLRIVHEALRGEGGDVHHDTALEGLTDARRAQVVRLACHPDVDLGAAVAAHLWRLDDSAARDLLDDLVSRGLLEVVSDVPGHGRRYRFAAWDRASRLRGHAVHHGVDIDAERRAAASYYRRIAFAAHEALLPGRWVFGGGESAPDVDGWELTGRQAVALMDAERSALRAAVLDSVDRGDLLLAFELCEFGWAYWFTRGNFSDVVDTHTELLNAVLGGDGLGGDGLDPARVSRILVQRSIAYRRDKETESAAADADRALQLARAADPRHPLALLTALEAVGDCRREQDEPESAEEYFAEALYVAERLPRGDVRAVFNALRKLAEVRADLGRLTEAWALLAFAEELLTTERPDDRHNLARIRGARGDLAGLRGEGEAALELWSEAVLLHGELGDERRMGDMRVRRADVLEARDLAAARHELERAVAHYGAAGAHRHVEVVRGMLERLGEIG